MFIILWQSIKIFNIVMKLTSHSRKKFFDIILLFFIRPYWHVWKDGGRRSNSICKLLQADSPSFNGLSCMFAAVLHPFVLSLFYMKFWKSTFPWQQMSLDELSIELDLSSPIPNWPDLIILILSNCIYQKSLNSKVKFVVRKKELYIVINNEFCAETKNVTMMKTIYLFSLI